MLNAAATGRTCSLVLVALLFAALGAPVSGQEIESRYFDSDGIRIHYIDEGAGEPVLLIHGIIVDVATNWVAPGVVTALVDAGYRVIAYDTRGHGRSAKPYGPSEYGPPEVQDALRLLDHLGIARTHLVGYSRGGSVANRIRDRYPDRLRSVVLGGYADSGSDAGPEARARKSRIADALEEGDVRPLARWLGVSTPEQVEGLRRVVVDRNDPRAVAQAFRAGESFGVLTERALAANEVPTLVIVGSDDPFSQEADRARAVMGSLEVLVIPGAGHLSALRRPELVTGLLGFLGKQDGSR